MADVSTGDHQSTGRPARRQGQKPAPPDYRKLTLNVAPAVHETMQRMADERGIPVTELLRRAFVTFRVLDDILAESPDARFLVERDGQTMSIGAALRVGKDVW